MKATAIAPSNIAFIKYWGRTDEKLRLPKNSSISMNLSSLLTTTTVLFSSILEKDTVIIYDSPESEKSTRKIIEHLDRIRAIAKTTEKAKVVSKNNFPIGTGLSSSASGFAALTVAAAGAAGLRLSEKELSILARCGSGSACRSIPDGFVEWTTGKTSAESYAVSLFRSDYWDIVDVVVILTEDVKDISTTEGQKIAVTSQFYKVRLANIKNKIQKIKKAIKAKNFAEFGEITEGEALELFAIMLTSKPSLIYWHEATVTLMKLIKKWREDGLPAYFTLNTGQNMHIITQRRFVKTLVAKLSKIHEVQKIIINEASRGSHLIDEHLF